MTITGPIDGENSVDNLICPRCGTSQRPHAIFCNFCGERIKENINEERIERTENGDEDAQVQEVADTVRLPSRSRKHLTGVQSNRPLKNIGMTGQTYKSNLLHQDGEAPTVEELSAPSIPVPDIEMKKIGAVPLSQHLEQQITRLLSIVDLAHQKIVGMVGSNSSPAWRGGTLVESAKDVIGMKQINSEAPEFPIVSNNNSVVNGSIAETWGWLPTLSLTSAIGVFLVALASDAGRVASQWADLLFWLGLLVLFLPIAQRLLSTKPTRRERIALLMILGSALYLFRDLEFPLAFAYNDEFLHWRVVMDIATSGHLFTTNSLFPIGPFYPGLEILTNALSSLTGLSIFVSGMIVLSLAGLLLVLSLYLFYEYISGSAQVAGITTLLYTASPVFFADTQFTYESLAIPITAFVLFVIARRSYAFAGHHTGLTLVIWLGLATVVITHHLTSYVLVSFLLLWTGVFLLPRIFRRIRDSKVQVDPSPGGVALLGLALCVVWLKFTGDLAVGYLGPYLDSTVHQLILILHSEGAPRQLFHDGSGFVEPLWERMTVLASVGLIVLGLPFGLFQIWRHYRANAVALALAIGSLAYPFSQAARLTQTGVVIGARAQAFLFASIGFVLAIGVMHFWLPRIPNWKYSLAVTASIAVIFTGGWITNTAPLWYRLPGPYVPSADHRSIEPESVDAAKWARAYLGPGHRIIADASNLLLMATYGNERIVTAWYDKIVVSSVYLSPHMDAGVERALRRGRIQYIVVDHRLSTGLPRMGSYFYEGDPNEPLETKPINPAVLAKFDGVQNVSRVLDSGNIVIYDVKAISNATPTAPASKALCATTPPTAVSDSSPHVSALYRGTIGDVSTGLTTEISLSGIQQQQGNICGTFGRISANALFNGMPKNSSFKGTISSAKQIQFTLTGATGQPTFSFEGLMLADGSISGTYCSHRVVTGHCSDYGLWIVFPIHRTRST